MGGAEIWAKREDCNSGLAYGGNKTRKLEYLVADAVAQGCDTLVSIGGVQSNHTRQVAAAAARMGMRCVLVQESWVDWSDPVYDKVGNILLSRILGADIRMVQEGFGIGFKASWEQALDDVRPLVASRTRSLPARRIIHWAGWDLHGGRRRSRNKSRRSASSSTRSSVCSVTGSTQAGMIAGFAAQERPRRVIGIDASAKPEETLDQVTRIARQTAALIEIGRELRSDEIILDARYHAGTYGLADDPTVEAIKLGARLEGMITDPVYEGKSLAGMIDMITTKEIHPTSKVLYAHLGGQPALNGYSSLFS